ncbi:hypothetical protein A2707_00330 [Candidatus Saccharibacteria bacterium RIFCSPHIGHO2_01_FULL_45_15]|nr:MAG: hypothetical protein A2707_00330 [Candidatus Saccharibacteria bacterium RIFCSPHIGHO2_01_FULL_45_15]OGL27493.1 MAG: hypothetical protein A3C39_03265 [Candidatus Saccharibacteria bacterium RIFCSPHIGHO2_02_FULL_46_12]OGL32131.1 MAG: hypothetical protein A3E76_03985 [Candidatus Saccharibacteria bacterium RIFCSPHIGHO2_12_FULL_44_22]
MTNRVRVTVATVNEAVRPAVVTTDRGVFHLKRGMSDTQRQHVMRKLQLHADGGEQCIFVCVLQNKRSGGRHTLFDVLSL